MGRTGQRAARQPLTTTSPDQSRRPGLQRIFAPPATGRLAELAASVNSSPAVQMLRELAADLQGEHTQGCGCPSCATSETAEEIAAASRGMPGPESFSAHAPGSATVQRVAKGIVQRASCTCNKSGNKHASNCPRNPKNLRKKNKQTQTQHTQNQSWINLSYYDSDWVKSRNVTEEVVKKFIKDTGEKIHGHHSGDPSQGRHEQTSTDIITFHSWYKQNYQN